jgi:hypothetical protein
MLHTFCRRASWERRRPGGQAYQKPHFYYLHRIAFDGNADFREAVAAETAALPGGRFAALQKICNTKPDAGAPKSLRLINFVIRKLHKIG